MRTVPVFLLLWCCLASVSAPAVAEYVRVELGTLGGEYSEPSDYGSALNASGQVPAK